MKRKIQAFFLILVFGAFFPALCLSAEVSKEIAGQVAENYLNHYQAVYGPWAQSDQPSISGYQRIEFNNVPVAHNFIVSPSGHILVAYWDEFSPVLLYSTVSRFDPEQVGETGSIAAWILPEIYHTYEFIRSRRASLTERTSYSESRVAKAWEWLRKPSERFSAGDTLSSIEYMTVGPLLTTTWNQENPYNLYTPAANGCLHTATGCVATAWAQLLKYWNWPDSGTGSHSYLWRGTTLTANFDHAYNWSSMPDDLTSSSTSTQKDAVARLISDIGIAADMEYGCGSSGSDAYANDVLDVYFKYKSSMQQIERGGYTADQWFNLFRTEFDATPARPVVLSIWNIPDEGHEVIADGYQTGATDKVHVNLGWSGSYDGFYDITNNFTTGSDTWRANSQIIVTHIEPDTTLDQPVLAVSPAGQNVAKGTGTTAFSVSNTGTGTMAWTAAVISESNWLSITSGSSGSNSGTIICGYSANPATSSRTATIRITAGAATGSPVDVKVTQAPGPTPTPTPTPTACTATINGELLLHIPYLSYADPTLGTLFFWADFVYTFHPTYPEIISFKFSNAAVISDPSLPCAASTISGDFNIHIPDVLFPDGSTRLWLDLEYSDWLSTAENAYFTITNYGVISN